MRSPAAARAPASTEWASARSLSSSKSTATRCPSCAGSRASSTRTASSIRARSSSPALRSASGDVAPRELPVEELVAAVDQRALRLVGPRLGLAHARLERGALGGAVDRDARDELVVAERERGRREALVDLTRELRLAGEDLRDVLAQRCELGDRLVFLDRMTLLEHRVLLHGVSYQPHDHVAPVRRLAAGRACVQSVQR